MDRKDVWEQFRDTNESPDMIPERYKEWLENKVISLTESKAELWDENVKMHEILNEIPCLCNGVFKARNKIDPACPKCNWIKRGD